MNIHVTGQTTNEVAMHTPFHIPFFLLAAEPLLQGICLWGPRTGFAEHSIEWLLRQRGGRPVRLPVNAMPESVGIDPVATTVGSDAAPVTTGVGLLERARGGTIIIEAADLVSRATAAALVRALAHMRGKERPLLIARSEVHPSQWPLIADQCAFWVREPEPGSLYMTWQSDFGDDGAPSDAYDHDNILHDLDLDAAATSLQHIRLSGPVVERIVSRLRDHHGEVGNGHGVDLFAARTAAALAAVDRASSVTAEHVETALQLVAAPRWSDQVPSDHALGDQELADGAMMEQQAARSTYDNEHNDAPADRRTDAGANYGEDPNIRTATDTNGLSTGIRNGTQSDTEPQPINADHDAGDGSPRLIVVPPAALFTALSMPNEQADRQRLSVRARIGETGTPAGVAPGYVRGHRVALGATLQAAIPWQRLRRNEPEGRIDPDLRHQSGGRSQSGGRPHSGITSSPIVQIRPDDLRSYRRQPRPKTLYIIAVDGSGSMARGRMQMAKSAALSVLSGAYRERRYVSLIDFRGDDATLMCPPGRSSAAIRKLITAMPSGGGTPIPAALALARDVARRWVANNPQTSVSLIMFTDGKANVPLSRGTSTLSKSSATSTPSETPPGKIRSTTAVSRRAEARDDMIRLAQQLRDIPVHVRFVDSDGWRVSPELHDVAMLLGATIVRLNRRQSTPARSSST